jgi:hypothetical protein
MCFHFGAHPVPFLSLSWQSQSRYAWNQNSEQFMTTRPRQVSLRQIILHFSCTKAAPQIGQVMSLFGGTADNADSDGFIGTNRSSSAISGKVSSA